MHRKILFVLQIAFVLVLMLHCVTAVIRDVGLDAELYYELQMREDVPTAAGISEEDLMRLDKRLALSLHAGEVDRLQTEWVDGEELPLTVVVHGVEQPAFNEREILHMQDCCRLFSLLEDVRWACFGVAFVLLAVMCAIYVLLDDLKKMVLDRRAFWLASGIILVPIAVLGMWAAIDFDSAFTFFHKLLFTNDLWLLDPRTDLLINICPQSMFMRMGLRIALRSAVVLLGVPVLATVLHKQDERKRKQNEVSDL